MWAVDWTVVTLTVRLKSHNISHLRNDPKLTCFVFDIARKMLLSEDE